MKIRKIESIDTYEVVDPCCYHITNFLNKHRDLFKRDIMSNLRLTRMDSGLISHAYLLFCPLCGTQIGLQND
jgi:hypothetical protein